jgi:DNA-binding GntR family transcriptional regulator
VTEPSSQIDDNTGKTRITRVELVRQTLTDDIAQGTLTPGMVLDEIEIATRLNVSRTPVREAIRDLAALGLVETRPHRSAIVSQHSADQLRDMFTVMAELEAMCAAHAAVRATPAERASLSDIHAEMEQIVRTDDLAAYKNINDRFHTAIYEASHNSYLQELTLQTRKRLSPFRRAQFSVYGRLARSHAEHADILQAILRGEAAGAATAMRNHIVTVENNYDQYAVAASSKPFLSPKIKARAALNERTRLPPNFMVRAT